MGYSEIRIYSGIYSGYSAPESRIARVEIQVFRNESSSKTNAYSHYSNCSYSGLIPNERALSVSNYIQMFSTGRNSKCRNRYKCKSKFYRSLKLLFFSMEKYHIRVDLTRIYTIRAGDLCQLKLKSVSRNKLKYKATLEDATPARNICYSSLYMKRLQKN